LTAVKSFFQDLNKLNSIASQNKWIQNNWDIKNSLKEEVIIVTDAKLKIVFASHNIVKMNGYVEAEVLGKSPKMFQGEATNQITSNEIRKAIVEQQPFEKIVMNYKKNGEVYACLIKGFPVFNTKGDLSHYIAFEKAA
jgi:PAS domain S-box-containing protein